VAKKWNQNKNCGLVIGASYPEELKEVRQIVGDMPILLPGIGAQGGGLSQALAVGLDTKGRGLIVNASRSVIYASAEVDFALVAGQEVERLHNLIHQLLRIKS
jgi:orotidine-5'-phosphate decarboxylase